MGSTCPTEWSAIDVHPPPPPPPPPPALLSSTLAVLSKGQTKLLTDLEAAAAEIDQLGSAAFIDLGDLDAKDLLELTNRKGGRVAVEHWQQLLNKRAHICSQSFDRSRCPSLSAATASEEKLSLP